MDVGLLLAIWHGIAGISTNYNRKDSNNFNPKLAGVYFDLSAIAFRLRKAHEVE